MVTVSSIARDDAGPKSVPVQREFSRNRNRPRKIWGIKAEAAPEGTASRPATEVTEGYA